MFGLFRQKAFQPDFPIIDLYCHEAEAWESLSRFGKTEEAPPDSSMQSRAQKVFVAESNDTRIIADIFNGRVRYTAYLTDKFNHSDRAQAAKLAYFVKAHGGSESDPAVDLGHKIVWEIPSRHILVQCSHIGSIVIIDQNPSHWSNEPNA